MFRSTTFLITISTCLGAVVSSAVLFSTDETQQVSSFNYFIDLACLIRPIQNILWNEFKVRFGKSYGTLKEEAIRRQNFLRNLQIADLRNEAESARNVAKPAVHGVTRFSDLEPDEFKKMFLNSQLSITRGESLRVAVVDEIVQPSAGLVDWSGVYTTPVKDQASHAVICRAR